MTTKEKIAMAKNILQANKEYEEAKQLLYKSYAEKFEQLPCTECGEVDADSVLALNEWAENESKRLLNEWVNRVVHA